MHARVIWRPRGYVTFVKKLFIQINDVKHVKFNLRLKKKNKMFTNKP